MGYSISATESSHPVSVGADILTPLTEAQALYNTRLQYFGEDFTKIACFSKPIFNPHKYEQHKPKGRTSYSQDTENESRKDSIKRAKDKVFQICYANDFKYFITLTLDETKISRVDVEAIKKALGTWLKNLVYRYGVFYVLVPEYHADGQAIHFHGLMGGNLKIEDSGTVLVPGHEKPMKAERAKRLGLTGRTVYNLPQWPYGFSTAIELDREKERTAVYITKYITKDNDKITGKFYYSGGKALKRDVPTEYRNYPYCQFEGLETKILDGVLAVKYKTL